jgi:hypothetical protein
LFSSGRLRRSLHWNRRSCGHVRRPKYATHGCRECRDIFRWWSRLYNRRSAIGRPRHDAARVRPRGKRLNRTAALSQRLDRVAEVRTFDFRQQDV